MKIVHVVDYFQPQLGYQEYFLAKEQSKAGHDVTIITSDRYAPILFTNRAAEDFLGKRFKKPGFYYEEGIKVKRLPVLFEFNSRVWMRGLERELLSFKPDVVNVDGFNTISAFRVARLKICNKDFKGVKVVIDDHLNPLASRSILKILYPLLKITIFKIIIKGADYFIAVSEETKKFMNRNYGISLQRIKVIPLGADISIFRYDEKSRKEIRSNLGIAEEDFVFIYTGKVVPIKRLDILVEAASRFIKKYNNIKIVIMGYTDRQYEKKLKKLISSKKVENNFIWQKAVPNRELYKYYSASDVAVWPHLHTNSILEAMACGLPVIVCSEPRSCEEVKYENGLIYQDLNADDLARKMEEIYLSKELRAKLAQNALKVVNLKYNWSLIAKEFIKIYEEK